MMAQEWLLLSFFLLLALATAWASILTCGAIFG